ncbi:hypothetical protein FOA52_011212 [Chlamydomonas sp. UWO 241]|nr:hypothetical protein FOA52_011212 [Chlamydomonas sp. UWO 241]
MIATRSSTRVAASCTRVVRVPSAGLRARLAAPSRPLVVVRAESDSTSELTAKAQEKAAEVQKYLTDTWESTSDSEKPAVVAIILAVSIAQIAIGAAMDKIDRIPIFGDLLELIGVVVVAAYAYKFFTSPEERDESKARIDSFVDSVTGTTTTAKSASSTKSSFASSASSASKTPSFFKEEDTA